MTLLNGFAKLLVALLVEIEQNALVVAVGIKSVDHFVRGNGVFGTIEFAAVELTELLPQVHHLRIILRKPLNHLAVVALEIFEVLLLVQILNNAMKGAQAVVAEILWQGFWRYKEAVQGFVKTLHGAIFIQTQADELASSIEVLASAQWRFFMVGDLENHLDRFGPKLGSAVEL